MCIRDRYKTEYVSAEVAQAIVEEEDSEEDLEPRAPIVTVMGHVDLSLIHILTEFVPMLFR